MQERGRDRSSSQVNSSQQHERRGQLQASKQAVRAENGCERDGAETRLDDGEREEERRGGEGNKVAVIGRHQPERQTTRASQERATEQDSSTHFGPENLHHS